jgi:hypothetical protein
MLKEFREFAMRGNVLDMAIGVIIGGLSERSSRRSSATCSCLPWVC